MHEAFAARSTNSDGDRGVAVELHVRDADEVVALGAVRLRDNHHDLGVTWLLYGDMRAGNGPVFAGDTKVTAVDRVHDQS